MQGSGLKSGMTVAFPRAAGARIDRRSPIAHLHHSALGMVVSVPSSAHSGHILVLLSGGKHSNSYGPIYVVRHALHPPAPKRAVSLATSNAVSGTAFDGQGMWIWYVSHSDGGNLAAIIAQAQAADVGTVFVKSSDGSSQLLEPVLPGARAAAPRRRAESLRLAVRVWDRIRPAKPISAHRRWRTAPTAW